MTLYYHFVGDTLRDGSPIPADGEWLEHIGQLVPCESGLHASEQPFDALQFAPGATLCLVELGGEIIPHGNPADKVVARRRRIIRRIDATALLRRFAANQAMSVAHLWDMPEIVREYLTTLDESKRAAAHAAAWDAAEAATEADWDAAWAATAAAARAAGAVARAAAARSDWDAARAASERSDWDAARAAAARSAFNDLVVEVFANKGATI